MMELFGVTYLQRHLANRLIGGPVTKPRSDRLPRYESQLSRQTVCGGLADVVTHFGQ